MIIRMGVPTAHPVHSGGETHELGAFETLHYSDAGRLTQFGAYAETL